MTTQTEVLIVGAGCAGLSASRELDRRGIKNIIVEARDRLGGRVFTALDLRVPFPIELGPEFIHGDKGITWDLIDDFAIPFHGTRGTPLVWQRGKLQNGPKDWDKMHAILGKLDPRRQPDRSLVEFLDANRRLWTPRLREMLLSYIESFHAADPARISERYLARAENQSDEGAVGKVFRPTLSYVSLLQKLAEELAPNIRLNTVVERLEWKKKRVRLHCRSGKQKCVYSARKVIVTAPISVLQESFNFQPEPAGLAAALAHFEMGHVYKLNLLFHERFWEKREEEDRVGLFQDPGALFPIGWTQAPVRVPLLTFWTGGAKAQKLSRMSSRAVTALALRQSAKLFGKPYAYVKKQFIREYCHAWSDDPWSRGAYCYLKVGGDQGQKFLRRGIDDTIFFAGEALNPEGQTGTVEGALVSGREIARKIKI